MTSREGGERGHGQVHGVRLILSAGHAHHALLS
ncbi:hypothetical protein BH09PAT4_BH09PAT4_05880 [soil metagenome]